jgi:hypothetical protein
MRRLWPLRISSPHVPLGIPVRDGLEILDSTGGVAFEELDETQKTHRVDLKRVSLAIYDTDGIVSSVWYNDPAGRLTSLGRARKIQLYMARYTRDGEWELRIQNGWMNHWFNDSDRVHLVYGLHKDVIRVNAIPTAEETAA